MSDPAEYSAPGTALGQFEVWFVTGSQHLYGEAALRQVGEHAQTMV